MSEQGHFGNFFHNKALSWTMLAGISLTSLVACTENKGVDVDKTEHGVEIKYIEPSPTPIKTIPPAPASPDNCTWYELSKDQINKILANPNVEEAYDYYLAKQEFGPIGASAIVGVMAEVSGVRPSAREDKGPGRGVMLRSGDDLDRIEDIAEETDSTPDDLRPQLQGFYEEMQGVPGLIDRIRVAETREDAVKDIRWEMIPSPDECYGYAEEVAKLISNTY